MKDRNQTSPEQSHMRFHLTRNAGMTLVEVTIAIGIASFVAITIMGLLTVALNNSSEASERSRLSRVYRNIYEAVKPVAGKSDPGQEWQTNFCFTQDVLGCDESSDKAHYRVETRGKPVASLVGSPTTNAWSVEIRIRNIPRNEIIFERTSLLIKEPDFDNTGGI